MAMMYHNGHNGTCRCSACSVRGLHAVVKASPNFHKSVCRASDALRAVVPHRASTTSQQLPAKDAFEKTLHLNDTAAKLSRELITNLYVGTQLTLFVLGIAGVSAGLNARATPPAADQLARVQQLLNLASHLSTQLLTGLTKYCTNAGQFRTQALKHIERVEKRAWSSCAYQMAPKTVLCPPICCRHMKHEHLPRLQRSIDEQMATSARKGQAASTWFGASVGLGIGSCVGGVGSAAACVVGSAVLGWFAVPAFTVCGLGAGLCAKQSKTDQNQQQDADKRACELATQQANAVRHLEQLCNEKMTSLQGLVAVLDPSAPTNASAELNPAQLARRLGDLVCELVNLVQQVLTSQVDALTNTNSSSSSTTAEGGQDKTAQLCAELLTEVCIADSTWRTKIVGAAGGLVEVVSTTMPDKLLQDFLHVSQPYLTQKLSITPATAKLLMEDVKPTVPVNDVMAMLCRTWPSTATGSLPGSGNQGAGIALGA